MKRLFFLLLSLAIFATSIAQLTPKTKCPDFYVDVLNGTVNGAKPNSGYNELKEKFPCFTSAVEESNEAKCGGGIFFKDKDIYFYTKRDYIEIGPKFIGKTSIPVLGAKRNSFFNTLGNPKVKDDLWDAYETQFGTLVLHFDVAGPNGKVKYFQFSTLGPDGIQLCE